MVSKRHTHFNAERIITMAGKLEGKKVAILVADGFEQVEMTEPRQALEAEGAQITLISPAEGQVKAFQHDQPGDTFPVDQALSGANAADYDALVLPGGVANPDKLRTIPEAVQFVKAFFEAGKPVGAICHGPWTLIEADVVRGVTLTSWPSLQTDLRNAGANWVDEQVVTDKGLVTSRKPDDIPAFNAKLIEEFAEGKHEGQREKVLAKAA
jgi:protease I